MIASIYRYKWNIKEAKKLVRFIMRQKMFKLILIVLGISLFELQAIHVEPQLHDGRIIGGQQARAGQFSFLVAIYKHSSTGTYFCSGTIVNRQWIITAGQCVDNAIQFTIQYGNNNLTASVATVVATEEYYLHPDYNPSTHEHDIGLIKLRTLISYTQYVHPIDALDPEVIPDGTDVTTAGWGATSDSEASLVDHLHYVELVTISNEECSLSYGSQITDTMVCVSGSYNEGICRGDLGGPLVYYNGTSIRRYLVGISSFMSSNGCESTEPSGFTRMHPYAEWAEQTITDNS